MSKNKLLIKWGNNSSSDSDSRKTRSMSRKAEQEDEPTPPAPVRKKSPKVSRQKVKTEKEKKETMPDDIMRKFLEEKDEKKWSFFVDKLQKKDANVLKRLLTNTSEEESESSGQEVPKKKIKKEKENTDSESDGKKGKPKKKKGVKSEIKSIVISDSDSNGKKPKKENNGSDEDKPKKEDNNKPQNPAVKPEVKPKVKVEKSEVKSENGNVKIEKGKEDLQKEYYVFINGEKRLVRLVAEDSKGDTDHESDSSIKETKKPKTLKPFYTVSDSDESDDKKKKLHQLDGNGSDCVIMNTTAASSFSFGSSVEECGDQISLAPASSVPSFVTISDTSEKNGSSYDDSHGLPVNSNADGNAVQYDSHGDGFFYCNLCPHKFFTDRGLARHYKSAHDSEESDTSESPHPIAAECFILSSDGAVLSDKNVESETDLIEIDESENEPIGTDEKKLNKTQGTITEETVTEKEEIADEQNKPNETAKQKKKKLLMGKTNQTKL